MTSVDVFHKQIVIGPILLTPRRVGRCDGGQVERALDVLVLQILLFIENPQIALQVHRIFCFLFHIWFSI